MLVQKVIGLFSLPLCVHLLAFVALIEHRSENSQALQQVP